MIEKSIPLGSAWEHLGRFNHTNTCISATHTLAHTMFEIIFPYLLQAFSFQLP